MCVSLCFMLMKQKHEAREHDLCQSFQLVWLNTKGIVVLGLLDYKLNHLVVIGSKSCVCLHLHEQWSGLWLLKWQSAASFIFVLTVVCSMMTLNTMSLLHVVSLGFVVSTFTLICCGQTTMLHRFKCWSLEAPFLTKRTPTNLGLQLPWCLAQLIDTSVLHEGSSRDVPADFSVCCVFQSKAELEPAPPFNNHTVSYCSAHGIWWQ